MIRLITATKMESALGYLVKFRDVAVPTSDHIEAGNSSTIEVFSLRPKDKTKFDC